MPKKQSEEQESKYIAEFNKQINRNDKMSDYNKISELYEAIYNHYKMKLKDPDFNIKIKKIQIENELGKYYGSLSNSDITLFIGLLCALVPYFLQLLGFRNIVDNWYTGILTIFIFLLFLSKSISKDLKKDKITETVKNISLKVLDDIEKEQQENDLRNLQNTNIVQEVATAKEKPYKGKHDRKVKKIK